MYWRLRIFYTKYNIIIYDIQKNILYKLVICDRVTNQ